MGNTGVDWRKRVEWIDGYAARIKPYVRVRAEDSLLIKIPNQTYKLNPQGLKILAFLLEGGSIFSVLEKFGDKEKVSLDIYYFFRDLTALLKGCYNEKEERNAVEKTAFSIPYNTLPVLSEIAVTYRCNLSCRFCYAACGCKKDEAQPGLPAESLREILGIIKEEAQVPSVSFTGGEPMLRPDLPQLIRHAKSLDMWTNLITNGTLLTPQTVSALKDAGLDSAQVSVEAGAAALHDAIVRKAGAFDMTVRGIKELVKAGIRTHTNTTVSALNKNALSGIPDLVKELGLDKFSMNMLMPVGAAGANFDDTFISYSEIGALVEGVRRRAHGLGLEFMWYSPTPMCIFNPVASGLGNKGCAACDGLLSVAPDGEILPCSSYSRPMGNILGHKGAFKALWESGPFGFFRNKGFAHEKCRKCEDLAVCNGGCPLYWEKAGYKELLEAGRN
ncbi:MAG: radical SAM protein [Elusimicrobia bacterium]|nr:radical SAM protein [Elusimicrobiota bacterium]